MSLGHDMNGPYQFCSNDDPRLILSSTIQQGQI